MLSARRREMIGVTTHSDKIGVGDGGGGGGVKGGGGWGGGEKSPNLDASEQTQMYVCYSYSAVLKVHLIINKSQLAATKHSVVRSTPRV